jgi:hypothetical protein
LISDADNANPHNVDELPYVAAVNVVGQLMLVAARLLPDGVPATKSCTVSSTILPVVPAVLSLVIVTVMPFMIEPVGIANPKPVAFKYALFATVVEEICDETAPFVDVILPGFVHATVPPLDAPLEGKFGPAVAIIINYLRMLII